MDLIMLGLIILLTFWWGITQLDIKPIFWLLYLALVANGLAIATAFHILVLGLRVITTTVDHLIMIYRDLTSMLRIPVDLYIEPIRSLLTFVLPLGIMITFPAKALLGLLSPQLVVVSLAFAAISFYLSLLFWKYSLRHYQSASS